MGRMVQAVGLGANAITRGEFKPKLTNSIEFNTYQIPLKLGNVIN